MQIVTVLPAPRPSCTADWQEYSVEKGLVEFESWVFFQPWLAAKACHDMIWSGHTESTFLFTLSFMRSLREDFGIKQAYDVYALVPTSFYMIGVVAARIHYTVDVLIALLLTAMIYRMT